MGNKGDLGAQTCLRERRTLAEIKADGFEQDVCINDRHQAFSAELLPLALLGVGGVGYVASQAFASGSSGESAPRMGGCGQGASSSLLRPVSGSPPRGCACGT